MIKLVKKDRDGGGDLLEQIIELREKGYSFRKIAKEIESTVGKVQYRYLKYLQEIDEEQPFSHQAKTKELINEISSTYQKEALPPVYNYDEITLLAEGPSSLFACWEVEDSTKKMAEYHCHKPWSEMPKLLKLFDVTMRDFNGHNEHRFIEVKLPEMTNNWHFHQLEPNRTYIVELGVLSTHGTYLALLRSNAIDTPRKIDGSKGLHVEAVHHWQEGYQHNPDWLEHFSTYSYYESIK
ncbi:DUF4912 domain-containing protein [Bacillus solitudinis]|uniref:DUF4912 domain-containing protein n=1 Tax=Bacillus solitudinis TaxID=2014074 RepID=UPI001D0D4631|nr:DUF4912 domain-containing protein [Bacillus solitudinis]